MVPFEHSGFYPFAVVVLVACTPVVEWSLVGHLPVLSRDRLFHGGLWPCDQ